VRMKQLPLTTQLRQCLKQAGFSEAMCTSTVYNDVDHRYGARRLKMPYADEILDAPMMQRITLAKLIKKTFGKRMIDQGSYYPLQRGGGRSDFAAFFVKLKEPQ